jgi:hypothetical protein
MANEQLPKRSMIKVGKLFTMHRSLAAARLGAVKEEKLLEVLDQLRMLFVASQASPDDSPREREGPVPPKTYETTPKDSPGSHAASHHSPERVGQETTCSS